MSDLPQPDDIEVGSAAFWANPDLETLMTGFSPLGPNESFAIEDLTAEEWQTFVDAINQ